MRTAMRTGLLSLVPMALIVLTILVARLVAKWSQRRNGDGDERHAAVRYEWVVKLTVSTILVLDWMSLI